MIFKLGRTINLKLVILGEGGVGKTSIVKSFIGNEISNEYLPTIGSNTIKKDYEFINREIIIRVNIWDFGGQRSFNPFNPVFFRNIDLVLLVFDLSRPTETLKNLKQEYLDNIQSFSEDFIFIIVGNKVDLLKEKQKAINEIKPFLSKNDHIIMTSAKTGENITDCFELLIHTFLKRSEIMDSEGLLNNITEVFLKYIGKNEKELISKLLNLSTIDEFYQKVEPKLINEDESVIKKEDKDLKYYEFLKQELDRNKSQKNDVFDQFLINLSELDNTIKHLLKSHSKSPKDYVNNLKDLLITVKNDFEGSVEAINNLNIEESELIKILSVTKNELE